MKRIRNFVKYFFYITVGILLVCGISYALAGIEAVPVEVFGMIFLSSFITTLVTVLILPSEEDGKVKSCIKFVLHYLALCVIMIFLGQWFGWIKLNLSGIVMMAVDVGLVYLLTFTAYYLIDVKQADEINKMLQEKYGDEEL